MELRILYLCKRDYYLHKLSRRRFHAVQAISKRCNLIISGPGWPNWNPHLDLKANISSLYGEGKSPDLLFVYKPFDIPGIADINIPKCVSYDEMNTFGHPIQYTIKEITENKIGLVIAHYKNEMNYPEFKGLSCKMVNISHSAEKSIFKDWGEPKDIDLLLVGRIHPGREPSLERYPFRMRLYTILQKMKKDPRYAKWKIEIHPHPGYKLENASDDKAAISFAKWINRSKIALTCSGRYHCRYGKYAEIPACRTLLMADLPDEDQEFLSQFMAVLTPDESEESIIKKMVYYLEHEEERTRLTDLGYHLMQENYTQENYAEKFMKEVQSFLHLKGK